MMIRCMASWTQQAQLSGSKRQLQPVFCYDVMIWEKLRESYNSG